MNREQFWKLFQTGAQAGQAGALQGIQDDAALERLIKSQDMQNQATKDQLAYKQQLESDEQAKNIQTALGLKEKLGPRYKVDVSGSGGVSFSETPQDGLANFFQKQKLEQHQQEDLARRQQALSDRVGKTGISDMGSALGAVYKNWAGGKSVSPAMNYAPTAGIQSLIANTVLSKKDGKDPGAEFQALQNLANLKIKELSGTAVNKTEEGRQLIARGMSAGGNPELVKQGVDMIRAGLVEGMGNVKGGAKDDAINAYLSQRGMGSLDELIPAEPEGWRPKPAQQQPGVPGTANAAGAPAAPGQSPATPRMSFEEFKAAKRAGKL